MPPMCPSFHTMKPTVADVTCFGLVVAECERFFSSRHKGKSDSLHQHWKDGRSRGFTAKFNSVMVLTGPKRLTWKTDP